MKLHEATWIEVRDALRRGMDTFILPVGTVEPHGTHLPLGTDALIPEAIGEKLAERLGAALLPTVYYGVTKSLHGYPGSVRVEPETLERLVYEILRSMAFHGFRLGVVLNGHGGGEQVAAVDRAAYRAWTEHGLPVAVVMWWTLARDAGLTREVLGKEGGHAGTDETACILATRPGLVKRDLYRGEEVEVYTSGFKTYPYVGSIINYSAGEGDVVFDEERSKLYFDRLVDLVEAKVRWFKSRVEEVRP